MAPPPWPSLTNRPLLSSPSGSLRHCQPPQLSSSPPPLEACVPGPAGVDFPLTAAEGELTLLLLLGAKHRMAPPPWPSLTNRPLLSSPSGSLRHCQPPQLSSSPPPLEACVPGPTGVDFPLTAAEGELTLLLLLGAKHRGWSKIRLQENDDGEEVIWQEDDKDQEDGPEEEEDGPEEDGEEEEEEEDGEEEDGEDGEEEDGEEEDG
ncbi:proline-, glutamic acid- and leucine-rich protein 1-like [Pseudophryne corroboree]|uniref:proline-, glutamic acid- and leucine-rich protein 1-like n=1 Tax=Pseudophryne corroboree TaxID=495146 RepID=UPI003081C0B8